MIIGLNLAHDASAALTDSNGVVLLALAEERISRKKNHIGVPRKSLQELILNVELDKVEKIVIGSHDLLARSNLLGCLYSLYTYIIKLKLTGISFVFFLPHFPWHLI